MTTTTATAWINNAKCGALGCSRANRNAHKLTSQFRDIAIRRREFGSGSVAVAAAANGDRRHFWASAPQLFISRWHAMMKNAKKHLYIKCECPVITSERGYCVYPCSGAGGGISHKHDRRMRLKFIIQKALAMLGERQGFQLLQLHVESARTHLGKGNRKNAYASKWWKWSMQDNLS